MNDLRQQYSKAEVTFIWDTLDGIYDDLYDRNGEVFHHRTVDRLGQLDDVFKLLSGESTFAELFARNGEVQP
jgi:hypothetical protein